MPIIRLYDVENAMLHEAMFIQEHPTILNDRTKDRERPRKIKTWAKRGKKKSKIIYI